MSKKNTKFNYGWVILTILCLGLALANYSQYQVSAFGTQITAEMNLSATQFSTIATGPLIPGIFLSLVSGLLVDKFGATDADEVIWCVNYRFGCLGEVREFTSQLSLRQVILP